MNPRVAKQYNGPHFNGNGAVHLEAAVFEGRVAFSFAVHFAFPFHAPFSLKCESSLAVLGFLCYSSSALIESGPLRGPELRFFFFRG